MVRRKPAAMTAALAVACAVLAGCTSVAGANIETLDPATSTPSSTTGVSSSPSSASESSAVQSSAVQSSAPESSTVAGPSPTAASDNGLAASEVADRAAVESQWIKSWDVYLAIATTPAADREALIATVAIDPTRVNFLSDAAKFDTQGVKTYGAMGHRISWPQDINGKTTALVDDCQDRSQSGSMNVATGNKLTVGVPRDHYQGNLVKGDDGVWRVAEVYYLKDEPC